VKPGRSFIDEQRFGPYRFWSHRHEMTPIDENNTRVSDEIHYAIGFGPFGALAHALFVSRKLKAIVDYRHETLEKRFNCQAPAPAGMKT
jgi:ligand-binding SRPBCC domain-containing protein